jgi:hypothetical protein
MKYKALKKVVIDGVGFDAGSEITIHHDKTARLVMLGYIERIDETLNRAVGLDEATKPRKKQKGKNLAS